jgi:hypothetical protein
MQPILVGPFVELTTVVVYSQENNRNRRKARGRFLRSVDQKVQSYFSVKFLYYPHL